jgi:F0F1-type ATP synthase membrane subunit c/vacuolar-type H+-ATPase subunit K
MKKTFCRLLAVALSCMMPAMAMGDAGTTALMGVVRNSQNQPVSGVKILAKVSSGQIVSEGTTDNLGRYQVQNLPAGRYQFTLDPANSSYKGQTVVSAVGDEGLVVNWLVSQSAPALAMATPGATPGPTTPPPSNGGLFGMTPMQTGGVIFLGGGAIGTGIAAAVGAFHEGSQGQPRPVSTASQ